MSNTVRIIWKCTKPKNQQLVALYEQLMTNAAQINGMDTAVIRHGIHNTTKVGGKYVKAPPHITGDILDTTKNLGFALHYNVDPVTNKPLTTTPAAPNPQLWPLQHKAGKGFVLVQDGQEIVHDVD